MLRFGHMCALFCEVGHISKVRLFPTSYDPCIKTYIFLENVWKKQIKFQMVLDEPPPAPHSTVSPLTVGELDETWRNLKCLYLKLRVFSCPGKAIFVISDLKFIYPHLVQFGEHRFLTPRPPYELLYTPYRPIYCCVRLCKALYMVKSQKYATARSSPTNMLLPISINIVKHHLTWGRNTHGYPRR